MALYFSGGAAVCWTFTEYYVHRFVLHKELLLSPHSPPSPAHLSHIFSRHLNHHVFMNQRSRIAQHIRDYYFFVPPLWLLVWLVLPSAAGYPLLAGLLSGSLFYDAVHLAYHFDGEWPGCLTNSFWFRAMKSAHMRHHFRDNSKEFGVTTDLWDRVLGTKRDN